jgi:hypothetical protein
VVGLTLNKSLNLDCDIWHANVCTCIQVAAPPSFLNPDATRQRKTCVAHVHRSNAKQNGEYLHDKAFDISRMAPRLKGQPDTAAVLSAPAKRARTDKESQERQDISQSALVRSLYSPLSRRACP